MYCLAIDIGASGGRHILGSIEDGKIVTREIYRFQNGAAFKNGYFCWDVPRLFSEIINGMKKCTELGIKPVSMGIDCFGVDFVLLDENGEIIGNTVSYRDKRTEGIKERIEKIISSDDVYKRTGVQGSVFSSVFQLISIKETTDDLKRAKRFLQLPDYFNYMLTGVDKNELTNTETTLLLNAEDMDFDYGMIKKLGLPEDIFKKPAPPMTILGDLKPDIAKEVGFNCKVVLPATHDTISAMIAAPGSDDCVFISSGTWSMLGVSLKDMVTSDESKALGFSNMYVSENQLFYLTGVTGLWMIQSIKKELQNKYTYDEMCDLAIESGYSETFDVNDESFTAPESMIEAIKTYLNKHAEKKPQSIGDVIGSVYHSLAAKYAETVENIEKSTGKKYPKINIVGGGSKDTYLNKLTAQYSGKQILAGPSEATAIGNMLLQFTAMGITSSLDEAKKVVENSDCVKRF